MQKIIFVYPCLNSSTGINLKTAVVRYQFHAEASWMRVFPHPKPFSRWERDFTPFFPREKGWG
jgi:hypothetical protein